MKTWFIALVPALVAGAATANPPHRVVDLDQPGAIEALSRSNPGHFIKLQPLLTSAIGRDAQTVESFLLGAGGKATYRANAIEKGHLARASLFFTLDQTRYVITVTVPEHVAKPDQPYVRTIDLDSAAAVAALRSSNPQHFDRLRQLLERNIGRERGTVEQFVRTAGATDIHTGPLIQTSYPAQAQMSFVLDDTRYRLRVRLGGARTIPIQ